MNSLIINQLYAIKDNTNSNKIWKSHSEKQYR